MSAITGADGEVSALAWGALALLVALLLAVDLLLFGARRTVTLRAALTWSVVWMALAFGFGAVLWLWQGSGPGADYLTGYLLERSLSLDNVFVFAVILAYFAVPAAVQPRVLGWGIALALLLRLVFILVGAALLASFHATFYVFGAILLFTAWRLARHDGSEIEPEHNPALVLLRRRVAMTTRYDGRRLFVREGGRRLATPLLAVFLVIATTDVLFAVDSIPAIFAITQEPYIVFAANAFAMLGLRALYFVLVHVMDRLEHLSAGLGVILAFIGVKMLLIDVWHPPSWLSLGVIAAVLGALGLLSSWRSRRRRTRRRAGDTPPAAARPRTTSTRPRW